MCAAIRAHGACDRDLIGVECHQGTTTFKVAELDITRADLGVIFHDSYHAGGWTMFRKAEANAMAARLAGAADRFHVGDIIQLSSSRFRCRRRSIHR